MTVAPSGSAQQAPPLPEPIAPATIGPSSHRRLRIRARRRRWWVLGAALVVLVVAGGIALWYPRGASSTATTYRQVAATTGTMRLSTAASGTLEPGQLATLNFPVSGQVVTVAVSLGQHVRAGQTLATITSALLAAQVAQAEANLAGDRAKTSADQNAGASAAQITADRAAVTAAQKSLSNSRASLDEATLTSPIAGTVAQLNLMVGQQVAGSAGAGSGGGSQVGGAAGSGTATGTGSGPAAGSAASSGAAGGSSAAGAQVVVAGSAFVVDVPVDDTAIGLMKVGEQAVIIPQGARSPVYGTVTSVGLLATATSGVPSFPVVVSVTGAPRGLFAGATAAVTIVYRQLSNVVEVPAAAVHYSGGRTSVLQSRGGATVSVPVEVGNSAGGFTQITAGLSAGQPVLVPGGSAGRSATSTAGTGTGTRGGFGGGGFGGGGFGGGAGR